MADNLGFDLGFPRGMKPYLVTLQKDAPSPFVRQPRFPPEEKKEEENRRNSGRNPAGEHRQKNLPSCRISAEPGVEAADQLPVAPANAEPGAAEKPKEEVKCKDRSGGYRTAPGRVPDPRRPLWTGAGQLRKEDLLLAFTRSMAL